MDRRLRNRSIKTMVKTAKKKFENAVSGKDKEKASSLFISYSSVVDKAMQRGVFHKNNAARKKSRMNKLLNTLK